MKGNGQKAEFLERMIQEVREIPVEQILEKDLELARKGSHYLALCPFHPDTRLGSFVITPEKKMWKCFACGAVGNGIQFVMDYHELPFLKACFKIALDFGIITPEEYSSYSRKRYDPTVVRHIEKRAMAEEKKTVLQHKAPEDIIHNVYLAMARTCDLSKSHKQHLLKDRHLKEAELSDYFTFPTRRTNLAKNVCQDIVNRLLALKDAKNLSELSEQEQKQMQKAFDRLVEELPSVPGFFKNNQKDAVDFVATKGIGLLTRDDKGHVTGIQVRRDSIKEGESRYVWFSSAFALADPNCSGGASSGSPGGVIYHKHAKENPLLCITEGRFKAEAVAEFIGDCIYVSGVSTWKSILPIVERMKGRRKDVYLMFDADLFGNVAVHQQLKELAKALSAIGMKPSMLLWPKERGKGFDDYVYNVGTDKFRKQMRCMTFKCFEQYYQIALAQTFEEFYIKKIKELDKSRIDEFCSVLQEAEETILGLRKE